MNANFERSKKRSNRLFEKLGIPLPRSWPQCGLPLMVKPSVSSGSQGVARIDSEKTLHWLLLLGSKADSTTCFFSYTLSFRKECRKDGGV